MQSADSSHNSARDTLLQAELGRVAGLYRLVGSFECLGLFEAGTVYDISILPQARYNRFMKKSEIATFRIASLTMSAIIALAVLAGCSNTGEKTPEFTADAAIEIPFTLTKWNNIVVAATVNDTDQLNLMFHTDAGSVVVTQEAAKRCTSLEFDQDATMESWGGKSDSRFSTGNQLQIQSLSWNKVTIFEDVNSGHETDGKFGPGQFDGKIVEIDFERNVLVVHNRLPKKADQFEKFTFVEQHGSFFVKGSITIDDHQIENSFLVHSGYSGAAMLDDQFVADNAGLKSLPILSESQVTDSMGNVLKTQKIELPSMQFGSMKFSGVPVSIFNGAIGRQKISLIGGDLLKRFDMILDAANNAIYLRINSLNDEPFFQG